MPLTEQGDELIHAVAYGGRDEAEPIGLRLDEFWIDTYIKIKYASGTLCLQSIIIPRISSTILELCSKNIMFAEHNDFKL